MKHGLKTCFQKIEDKDPFGAFGTFLSIIAVWMI